MLLSRIVLTGFFRVRFLSLRGQFLDSPDQLLDIVPRAQKPAVASHRVHSEKRGQQWRPHYQGLTCHKRQRLVSLKKEHRWSLQTPPHNVAGHRLNNIIDLFRGNFLLEVPEIYYTAGDKEVQGVLAGQSVETIAQVLPEKLNNPDGKRVRIFRLLIQCCAADARPFSIPVEFEKKAPEFKESTWVKVTGKMTYKSEGGQTVPVLLATTMTESAEPDNKMIY